MFNKKQVIKSASIMLKKYIIFNLRKSCFNGITTSFLSKVLTSLLKRIIKKVLKKTYTWSSRIIQILMIKKNYFYRYFYYALYKTAVVYSIPPKQSQKSQHHLWNNSFQNETSHFCCLILESCKSTNNINLRYEFFQKVL